MEISISKHNHDHIERKIESGSFHTPDEVIARALELLDEYDSQLAEEKTKVQEGLEQLDRGEYVDYTDETLDELFDNVIRRGRERRASRLTDQSD